MIRNFQQGQDFRVWMRCEAQLRSEARSRRGGIERAPEAATEQIAKRESPKGSTRTVILFIVLLPVIGYLVYFAYKKNTESEGRAAQCQQECIDKGFRGNEFKWSVLSGPQCTCIGEAETE